MAQAKKGDQVSVHYKAMLEDGSVFDSSEGRDPLCFILGEGMVIEGFEEAVEGMNSGDKKTVKIPADKAYGPYYNELLVDIGWDTVPKDMTPEVGQQYRISQEGKEATMVTVAAVSEEKVTLDANHPLAGKDLTFDLELVEVQTEGF